MNEEYLWDKSGEPDPEIQQLEEILGTLRYQPKPLVLPVEPPRLNVRRYVPLVAIAAALLFAALAGLAWLRMQKHSTPVRDEQIASDPSAAPAETPKQATPELKNQQALVAQKPKSLKRLQTVARARRSTPLTPVNQEALEAKDQLMIALRLASEKLGVAQRKVHGPASPNQIRNQHKIG